MLTLDIESLKEKAKGNVRKPNGDHKDTTRRARKILEILKRDKFTCVKCGCEINLTIDHIDGRAFAKHDNSQKYKLDKCQTLCGTCHMEKNKNERKINASS